MPRRIIRTVVANVGHSHSLPELPAGLVVELGQVHASHASRPPLLRHIIKVSLHSLIG